MVVPPYGETTMATWVWSGGAWTRKLPAVSPTALTQTALAYDAARKVVLLFGGTRAGTTFPDTNELWSYDGTTWARLTPTHLPPARARHQMVYDSVRQRVLVLGGRQVVSPEVPAKDVWEWDGIDFTEVSTGPSSTPLVGIGLAFDAVAQRTIGIDDGRTIAWDGVAWSDISPKADVCAVSQANTCCNACSLLPITCAPECLSRAPKVETYLSAATGSNGHAAIFGAGALSTDDPSELWTWTGSTWSRDPLAGPSRRWGSAMASDPTTGALFVLGGHEPEGFASDLWRRDAAGWTTLSQGTNGLGRRTDYVLAFDPLRGRTVLFGGSVAVSGGPGISDGADTWTWDGTRWEKKLAAVHPDRRHSPAMVFDSKRGAMVLFGGMRYDPSTTFNDETWTWDGASWSKLSPATAPSARYEMGMAFHSGSGRVIGFGGATEAGAANDTWALDGTTWTELHPSHAPPAQAGALMAYDEKRARIVLYSVVDGTTWEWDDVDWKEVDTSSGMGARWKAGFAYDAERGRTVLFGGLLVNGSGTGRDDTWEWDGMQWTNRSIATHPAKHDGAERLAYDSIRKRTVFFGGQGAYDTWEYRACPDAGCPPDTTDAGPPDGGSGVDAGGPVVDAPDGGGSMSTPAPDDSSAKCTCDAPGAVVPQGAAGSVLSLAIAFLVRRRARRLGAPVDSHPRRRRDQGNEQRKGYQREPVRHVRLRRGRGVSLPASRLDLVAAGIRQGIQHPGSNHRRLRRISSAFGEHAGNRRRRQEPLDRCERRPERHARRLVGWTWLGLHPPVGAVSRRADRARPRKTRRPRAAT